MRKSLTKTTFLTAAGLAVGSVMMADTAAAQVAVEEIIVTARARAETLTDVPASVTAFTAANLESAGVARVEDFINLTPGVTIVNTAEVGDTQVNIRGINGARDAENSFAFLIDGVLYSNPAAFNRELVNLQQIEVLKGPQGALYGRNAAAGAIIVTTKKPTNDWSGEVEFSAGNNATYTTQATISGPLIEDELWISVNGNWRDTDGFYRNSFLEEDAIVDDLETSAIEGRLIWEPNDRTSIDIKSRYSDTHAASISFNAAFAAEFLAGLFGNPDLFADVNDHEFVFNTNIDPFNNQETVETSARLDYEFDNMTLTAWALLSDYEQEFGSDGTSGAFGFFFPNQSCIDSVDELNAAGVTLPSPQFLGPDPASSILGPYTPTRCDGTQYQRRDQKDFSFEIRLSSTDDTDLRWQIGTYFLDIERQVGVNTGIDQGQGIDPRLFAPPSSFNPTEQLVFDQFDSRILAGFANVGYDITDDIELSAAIRYDNEQRKVRSLVPTGARSQFIDFTNDGIPSGNAPLNPALNPTINPSGVIPDQEETFDQFQPKISATWDVVDSTTLFASWGIGFKSGGFNNSGSAATIDLFINDVLAADPTYIPVTIEDVFAKEKSSAFEAGFKSRFADNRISVEGAVYHTIVDDMQFFEFFVGSFGLLRVVNNIDEVRLTGAEFAFNAQVTDWFTLNGGFNYTDSEIKQNDSRPATVGNDSPYTADYTVNLGGEVNYPVTDNADLFLRADWSMVGPTWFHTVQDNSQNSLFAGANYSRTERDEYDTLNLRGGVVTDSWSIIAYANNVTNTKYLGEVIPAPEFGGSFIHPGALRSYGIELKMGF